MSKEILRVKDLTFRYESYNAKTGEAEPAPEECLKHLSFTVEEGSFFLISGSTGSGKSTLLHLIKEEVAPAGYKERAVETIGLQQKDTALLLQNPKAQCLTDKVWHELAFGLENEGLSQSEMESRIAETASFFDLEKLLQKNTAELSGGELQLVNLAALMVKRPRLLLLDEPTSQLDPAAELRFLQTLRRIHEELGLTVLMVEHNLSESLCLATHFMLLREGRLSVCGPIGEVLLDAALSPERNCRLNIATEAFAHWKAKNIIPEEKGEIPLTIAGGRRVLRENLPAILKERENSIATRAAEGNGPNEKFSDDGNVNAGNSNAGNLKKEKPLASGRDLWFRYGRTSEDVLRGLDFDFYPGCVYALLGGNGAGKSTLLRMIAGFEKPDEGKIKMTGKPAFLPQDPEVLFWKDSLKGEAKTMGKEFSDLPDQLKKYGEEANPYDLSGGEKELLALWKVLTSEAEILLLDEPQKGLDLKWRHYLTEQLRLACRQGKTIILVTHDTDFAAETADFASMISGGRMSSPTPVRRFFAENRYYTTPAARMAGDTLPGCVTREDILC